MTWYLVITSQFLTRLLMTVITFLLKTQFNKGLGDDLVRGVTWLHSGPSSACRSSLFSVHCVLEYLALNTIQRRMHFVVCYCLYTALYSYLGFSLTYVPSWPVKVLEFPILESENPLLHIGRQKHFHPSAYTNFSIDDSLQKSFGIFIFLWYLFAIYCLNFLKVFSRSYLKNTIKI